MGQQFVEIKTSTLGVVNATAFIRNQLAFDVNHVAPFWIFVNARASGPLINLLRQYQIPYGYLTVP